MVARLWAEGGFTWDLARVRAFAGGCVRIMLLEMRGAKTKAFTDFETEEGFLPFEHQMVSGPTQHNSALASEALALLKHLPNDQERALRILVDGGSPIDVAMEMDLEIHNAIFLIKEARRNIYLTADDHDY